MNDVDTSKTDTTSSLDNGYVGVVKDERVSPCSQHFDEENRIVGAKIDGYSSISCCPIEVKGKLMYPLKFPCPYCGIKFSNENTLKAHLHGYCTKINSQIDAHQNRGISMNQNWLEQNNHLIQPLLLDTSSESSVSPQSVLLEAIYHPDRLEANKCFRNGDIYFVAVRLDMPKVLSPTSPCLEPSMDSIVNSPRNNTTYDVLDLSLKPDDLTQNERNGDELKKQTRCSDGCSEPLDLTCRDVVDNLKCLSCGYVANSLRGMRLHERNHNSTQSSVGRPNRKRPYSNNAICKEGRVSCDGNISPYTCVQCGVQFSSLTTLNQHRLYYCRSNDGERTVVTSPPAAPALSLAQQLSIQCIPPICDNSVSIGGSGAAAIVMKLALENRCEHCNINFRHKSSYVAHKLHYCKATRNQHSAQAATQLIK